MPKNPCLLSELVSAGFSTFLDPDNTPMTPRFSSCWIEVAGADGTDPRKPVINTWALYTKPATSECRKLRARGARLADLWTFEGYAIRD